MPTLLGLTRLPRVIPWWVEGINEGVKRVPSTCSQGQCNACAKHERAD